MKERPILFSAPMVRAILAGSKTQTRRIVKPQPTQPIERPLKHAAKHPASYLDSYCGEKKTDENPRGMSDRWCWWTADDRPDPLSEIRCPYGAPGDRLWVRETWHYADWTGDGYPYVRYAADDSVRLHERNAPDLSDVWAELSEPANFAIDNKAADRKWRPSIFMPRWASRISLDVTGVRVERLHAITGRDVLAEGVDNGKSNPAQGERWENMQRRAFEDLWCSINGADSWNANPWVWVVEFKRTETR